MAWIFPTFWKLFVLMAGGPQFHFPAFVTASDDEGDSLAGPAVSAEWTAAALLGHVHLLILSLGACPHCLGRVLVSRVAGERAHRRGQHGGHFLPSRGQDGVEAAGQSPLRGVGRVPDGEDWRGFDPR